MKRVIALIDCDSFFVSCEQSVNKELKNKPVCVLSNNDGCVVSRAKEAKKMGIKMGMPYFLAKKDFPKGIYVTGNHHLYKEISNKVMDIIKTFSPDVEIYSIDEAFIDLTGTEKLFQKNYVEIIKDIKDKILKEIDIPVSIGLSSSKTLAKLASDKAKNTDGIYIINENNLEEELKNTKIEEVWGIGKNNTLTLKKKGILTCYDFINKEDSYIKQLLGIRGLEMKHELLGETISYVDGDYKTPKSIQDTSAFGIFTKDIEFIKKELNKHIHVACKKLRKNNGYAKTIGVMLRTKDFKCYFSKISLTCSTSFELEISKEAMKLLEQIYKEDILYRATGIYLGDLSCTKTIQTTLFSEMKQKENENISKVIDKLENKYGKNIIRTGF